jgi:cell division protein ZapA
VAVLTALNLAAELLQAKKAGGSNDQALSRALGDMNRKLDGLFDSLASR